MGLLNNYFILSNSVFRAASIGLIATIALLGVNVVNASPTSNEFEECHILASKSLLYCLNKNMNSSSNGKCWIKSRASYKSCHTRVTKRHDRSDMKKMDELAEAIEAEILKEKAQPEE